MKSFFKEHRVIVILTVLAVISCTVVGCVFLICRKDAREYRNEAVERLEATAGTYSENTVVLQNTSKYEAELLSKKLGAKLRISKNGRYAALYLPEGKNIVDVYKDDSNLKYVSSMSPDYYINVAEEENTEEEINIRIPKTPETEINETYYGYQSYLNYLNLGTLLCEDSPHITVAIIDSGIDTDHPEFAGRISEWSYNASNDKIVRDYGNDWSLIEDTYGHGTAVAGIIGAALDGEGITGILPNAELLIIKAECDDKGNYMTSDLVFGLYYAIERDAPVVNMSFALKCRPGDDPFEDAAILAYDSDIICIAAAGNDASPAITYPASNENVIGVGALDEDSWELANYSNYGDNVEVVAPGTVFTTAKGGGYKYAKGTSYSTPIVTAIAAMYKNNIGYYDYNEKFRERLHASCYDLGDKGPDFYYGYGCIDFNAMLCEPAGTVTFDMLTDELDGIERLFIHGHPVQDIPEPERLYSVFDGWYYDPQFTEELNWYEDSYNADITLYAKWANEDDMIPYDYRILDDETVEILGYKGKRRFITIPDYIEGRQVSSIGRSAFAEETRLRRIILPHYLVNIDDFAFYGNTNIVTMDLPKGVVNIGEYAFADCPRLTSITLGNSLQTVGEFAFANCGSLTSIYLPKTVRSIDGTAFAGDVSMMSILTDENNADFISIRGVLYNKSKSTLVAYPAALAGQYDLMDETVSIGRYAFYCASVYTIDLKSVQYISKCSFAYSSLLHVEIPDTCISLESEAFASCGSLSYLKISRGLEEISVGAFMRNGMLREVFIPNTVKLINERAFSESGVFTVTFEENAQIYAVNEGAFAETFLSEIEIPSSLIYIGASAFEKCFNLRSVSFANNSALQNIGERAFMRDSSLRTIDIPDTVRNIGSLCFSKCDLRGEIHLPATLSSYGAGIFAMCYRLTDIKIDPDNEFFTDVDGVVYSKDHTVLVEYPAGKTAHSFSPLETTEAIKEYAFYGNKQIDYMNLPNSVRTVGDSAFEKCTTVKEYILSQNLEYVGQYSFAENLSLTRIDIPDSLRQISRFTFAGDINLRSVYLSDESSMRRIGMYALAECGIEEFRIPQKITSVAQYAFDGCGKLRRVVFAENSQLQSISAYFFLGCDSIEEIIFESGSKLTSIQSHGFHGLTHLERIDFGDAKIDNIDNYAFRQCPSIKEIQLPETVTNIGRFAFYRCESLVSLSVPENVLHIGEYAFFGTNHLKLYFESETLPIYLDENWDADIDAYYTGIAETVDAGDWEYAVLKNGTVSVTKYKGKDKNIDLTSFEYGNVSIIGGYAFAYTDIESVILPDTLEQIQRYAFAECSSLQSITIPENVTFIAQYAFYKTGITSLTFTGDSLKVIERFAFSATKDLGTVTLPGSLEKLGTGVFYQSGITSVSFGEGYSMNMIPENAFSETKLVSVVIPDCVTEIGNNAFSHNHALKNVDFSGCENLMIRSNAFYNTGLTSVYIGENVSFIGEYAFADLESLTAFDVSENNLQFSADNGVLYNKEKTILISSPAGKTGTFVIPKKVEVLGFGAFENSKLSEIKVEADSKLVTFGYRAFYGAENLTSFVIPKGVVSIDYYAFAECDHLKTVTFEEGNRLPGIYEGAFFGCRSLENITLPDTIVEISDYAFYACESLDRLPFSEHSEILGIYRYAFAYTNIEDLCLPSQLYDIGAYAFRGIGIKELIIEPDDPRVLHIGIGAFADCDRLESVTLPFVGEMLDNWEDNYWFGFIFGSDYPHYDPDFVPESLKNITITVQKVYNITVNTRILYSFYRLPYVETVVLPEDTYYLGPETFMDFGMLREFETPHLLTAIEGYTFYGCGSLTEAYIPDGVVYIGADAFCWCESLEKLRLNDDLVFLGADPGLLEVSFYGTFRRCAFSELNLPESLEYIGARSFMECVNIKSVVIPENAYVKDNGELFLGCTSLEYVKINCDSAGFRMFSGCPNIKTLELSGDIRYIGDDAFEGCEKLEYIDIPEHLEYIGWSAFSGCRSLCIDLILPEGLKTIGNYAFDGSGITSVVIPTTVTEIGEAAFRFCDNLKSVDIRAQIKSFPGDCFYTWNESKIEEVKLPDTLEVIDGFAGCQYLRIRELPASLRVIGSNAFAGCRSISEIVLPEGLVKIEDGAFGAMTTLAGERIECNILSIVNNSDLPVGFSETEFGGIGAKALVIKDKLGEHHSDRGETQLITEDGMVYTEGEDGYTFTGYLGSDTVVAPPAVMNGKPVSFEVKKIVDPHIKLIIPEGVETVCFKTNVDEVVLPSTLNDFSTDGGIYWSSLIKICKITVAEDNETFWSNGEVLCTRDGCAVYGTFGHKTVTVPEGVTTTGYSAFFMRDMERVILPDSLTEIGTYSFQYCRNLNNVVLPDNCKSIGYHSFSGCSSLTNFDLGKCENMVEYAFYYSAVTDITIPGTLKNIPERAFEGCNLKTVVIEEGVESIGESAFDSCNMIESLSLPSSLKTVGANAFRLYKGEYRITENIEEIGSNAFGDAANVTIDEKNSNFILYDDIVYSSDGSSVVWIDRTKTQISLFPIITEVSDGLFRNNQTIESVIIPEGVTRIGYQAFEGCVNLKNVVLPETLRRIESVAFYGSGIEEIYLPSSLEFLGWWDPFPRNISTITVSEKNEKFFVKDGVLYDGDSLIFVTENIPETVVIPEGISNIEDRTFKEKKIRKVVFPSTLKRVGRFSFENSELSEIVWSDSVETVWDGAFSGTKITELILPDSVNLQNYIEGSLCKDCRNLKTAYIPAGITDIDSEMFINCTALESITVSKDNEYYYSYDNVIYKKGTNEFLLAAYVYNDELTIPEGVTEIPSRAFEGRVGLCNNVILPETLTIIYDRAFFGSDLLRIRIPASVRYISESAFAESSKLNVIFNESDIDIYPRCDLFPYSLAVVNKGVCSSAEIDGWYYYIEGDYICSEYVGDDEEIENRYRVNAYIGDLGELTLPTEIGGHEVVPYMFEPGKAKTLIIPEGVEYVWDYAFHRSKTLGRLILPSTVREFGSAAFSYSSITEINIPYGILYLDMWLFEECNNLSKVTLPDLLIGIEFEAFYRCYALKTIDLPDSLIYLSNGAFNQAGLEYIELPSHLETIGSYTFAWTHLKSIVIPDSVKSIGSEAFYGVAIEDITLPDTEIFLGADFISYFPWSEDFYMSKEENWDGDFLYIGNHLIRYRGNDSYVVVDRIVKSTCESAFEGCYGVKYLEISGNAYGALQPQYLTNLEMLIIDHEPTHRIRDYFESYFDSSFNVPDTLRSVVIKNTAYVEYRDEFSEISEIYIFVENEKSEAPFDRIALGWNNDNIVMYGDKWYMASFYDENGGVISKECFSNSQVIRPPYVVLPRTGDTAYTHIGWDLDRDGEPDGLPASRLSDVEAHAVVRTSKPAYYTVKFVDIDRKTVIEKYTLEHGKPITPPENAPEKKGYTFLGWENFKEGDTVSEDIKIYSVWEHNGDGHEYAVSTVEPTCLDRGYMLHKCSICGDEYRTDFVDANWHTFGDWITDKEPSCSENGQEHRVCLICGFEENSIIDTLGHSYESNTLIESTCTEHGVVSRHCSVCGDAFQEMLPLLPHSFEKVYADKDYVEWLDTEFFGIVWGCIDETYWYYTCSDCGKIETVSLAKASGVSGHTHQYSVILNSDGTPVAVRCPLCDMVICHMHTYEVTDERQGVMVYTCKNCGDVKTAQITYTVKFIDWDGSLISGTEYKYGDTVTMPSDPQRAADNTYTYSFNGWDKEITAVNGNAEYTATYTAKYIEYTVRFIDYNDTVISERTYHYGDTVIVPDDPEREEDEMYTYSFSGWDKEITEVKGNETYTATYEATEKQQTQFVPGDINGDGSVNNKDVVALFKYVSGGEIAVNDIALDINGDGSVNNKDVVALFKYVSGGDIELSDKPYDPNAKAMMFAIVPKRIRVY